MTTAAKLPTYVIRFQNDYLKVQSGCVIWTAMEHANVYSSKYQARKHLKNMGMATSYEIVAYVSKPKTEEASHVATQAASDKHSRL